ncbi:MAG TPA: histidine kinase [Cytophagales bacterium]|nr:histidine kinase [Cytophagales bacterium]
MTSDYIDTKIEWTKEPIKRFIVGMLVMIVYTLTIVYALVWLFREAFGLDIGDIGIMLYTSLIITFVISLFMHSRGFLRSWRLAEVEAEKAKQESIKANYESLKNQVNPHFLFNSLNALTSLVYEDQDKAAKFIKQLSEVYRYVLDSRNKEVVSIAEELQFLDSYLFLQQIRFGDKLRIKNELKEHGGSLPPLALQMLVENAIKHNIVSHEQPLTIHLYESDRKLVVRNNLQTKNTLGEASSGVGLENIRKRYEFLSDEKVEVENDKETFAVKLPILVMEE